MAISVCYLYMLGRPHDTQIIMRNSPQKKCRLFLGIPVSQNDYLYLKDRVLSHQPNLTGGKFTPHENMHLTIRFFGDISERKILWLCEAIQEKIQNHFSPFMIDSDKIALFPNQQSKVIAAYFLNNPLLNELFLRINEIDIDNNTDHNQKGFIPHVTLYRLKDNSKIAFPEISPVNRALPVNQLILYESQLMNEERAYQKIHIFK